MSLALSLGASLVATAHAQQVGVVRSVGAAVPAELAQAVDAALLRDLDGLADIPKPTLSPAAYEEIQLAVGCEGEARSCLSSVAQTLHTDAIVVSRLSSDDTGVTTLELVYFRNDGQHEAETAQASVPASSRAKIVDAVPGLVRRVFGLPQPADAASPVAAPNQATQPDPDPFPTSDPDAGHDAGHVEGSPASSPARISPLTWVSLGVGAVVLGIGIGVGASAQGRWDDLKAAPVQTVTDARHVHSELDSIESQGTVANVMMPIGGAVLGLGVALLILDLTREHHDPSRDSASLGLTPLRGGAALVLRSAFEGGG